MSHAAFYKRHGFSSLLATPDANPKLAKSLGINVYSAPMHLAPADLSGFNVCPMATKGCKAACLHTAGNPLYMVGKQRARIARTKAYFTDRAAFMDALASEIARHSIKARKLGMRPAVRLNATSDIPWETVRFSNDGKSLMERFPEVQFYDYTKRPNRVSKVKHWPSNYHLTFSYAGDGPDGNGSNAERAFFADRLNLAVVFNVKRGKPLPATWNYWGMDIPVIDGDLHDYRPVDGSNVIVGLRAKGRAIGDKSGFVVEPNMPQVVARAFALDKARQVAP